MWLPNRPQWVAIWVTALGALFLWIGSAQEYSDELNRQAVGILVLGSLIVWMLARKSER